MTDGRITGCGRPPTLDLHYPAGDWRASRCRSSHGPERHRLRAGAALARSHASQGAGRVEQNQDHGEEAVVLLLCCYRSHQPTSNSRVAENFRRKRRATTGPRQSPRFSTTAHTTLAEPQVFCYVEETTRRSVRRTKGDDVNRWGRQIRVKMVWLLR